MEVLVEGAHPLDAALGELLAGVWAAVLSTPWLGALLAVIVIGRIIRFARGILHGGHQRDPRRTFSRAEKAELLERAGHRCEHHSWLLGRCRETEALQADHVHPHSQGGATILPNGQALCGRHNRRKAAQVPWNRELARLERRRQACFPPGAAAAVVRHRPSVRRMTGDARRPSPT
jgi:hypothetical protein